MLTVHIPCSVDNGHSQGHSGKLPESTMGTPWLNYNYKIRSQVGQVNEEKFC